MLVKGNKIKMVKPIGDSRLLNQVFEVTNVENGVIEFRHNIYGAGVMSYSEFEQNFELVEDIKTYEMIGDIKVIRNGMATIVILPNGIKGVSKCLPEDTYDKEKGYKIAYNKAMIKSLTKELKMLSK